MVWLLTKHALQTWIRFGADARVTPALTLNMQIVNVMGYTVVTVKDIISLMVTMMATEGQVR